MFTLFDIDFDIFKCDVIFGGCRVIKVQLQSKNKIVTRNIETH